MPGHKKRVATGNDGSDKHIERNWPTARAESPDKDGGRPLLTVAPGLAVP